MVRSYDDYGNVVDLVKWEKQIRTNAIDECINALYEVTPQTLDQKLDMVFVNTLKRLKEN